MKKNMILGYAPIGAPANGIGPFEAIFDKGRLIRSYSDFDLIDGLVLWGGQDISPSLYKETPISTSGPARPNARDLFEWECIKLATQKNLPIIGICRGAQLLCAYAGGKLIQDVQNHTGNHSITTVEGVTLTTCSYHHQMMFPYDIKHELLAWSTNKLSNTYVPDNEIAKRMENLREPEVVYFPSINGIGIQGHPEWERKENPLLKWFLNQILEKCFTTAKV